MNAASEANLETYKQLAWTLISFINWYIINYKNFIYNIIYYEFFFFRKIFIYYELKQHKSYLLSHQFINIFMINFVINLVLYKKKNFVSFLVFYFILHKL